MIFLQERDLTVHFGTGKEVYNRLFVLFDKLLKRCLVRSLDSQNHLGRCIYILGILEFRLGINVLYIYDNNVAHQLQDGIKIFGRSRHDPERTFRLRKSGHICIEHIVQSSTGRTLPHRLLNHNEDFISTSAGSWSKHTFLAAFTRKQHYCYKSHTEVKQVLFHMHQF